jgi:hypothetical protein
MAKKLGRGLYLWGPVAAVLAVIFYYSAQSRYEGYVGLAVAVVGTKPFHLVAYFLLALTLLRAAHGGWQPLAGGPTFLTLLLFLLWSILDERRQATLPTRQAQATDVFLDSAGFVGALLLNRTFFWLRNKIDSGRWAKRRDLTWG